MARPVPGLLSESLPMGIVPGLRVGPAEQQGPPAPALVTQHRLLPVSIRVTASADLRVTCQGPPALPSHSSAAAPPVGTGPSHCQCESLASVNLRASVTRRRGGQWAIDQVF